MYNENGYNENGYDATLTACVNYWAMTDPKLTQTERDFYVFVCFNVNNMVTPSRTITMEEVIENMQEYFRVNRDVVILVLNSLISKGYLRESGWPNLSYVPENERYIPELKNNDNTEV